MVALAAVLDGPAAAPRLAPLAPPEEPGAGEVLVALRFAPINPADLLIIAGRYPHAAPPLVLGAEGVGEVVAVGEGVRRVRVGDAVLPLTRGNWCGLRKLREDELAVAPAGLPLQQAAMLRINGSTAWRLLSGRGLETGDWVIQNAAGSSVGWFVRALAARRGVRVLNLVRRPEARAGDGWLLDGPGLATEVRARVGQGRLRLALDAVAGPATGRLAACLDAGGRIIVFGHLSGQPCEIASTLLTGRGLTLEGFSLRPAEAADPAREIAAVIAEMAEVLSRAGEPPPVRTLFGLSELPAALAAAQTPGGRVMLALDR